MLSRLGERYKNDKPIGYFQKFSADMCSLKRQVENYNSRENDSRAVNRPQTHSQKRFLKKMTEPKYHQAVFGMMSGKQKGLHQISNTEPKVTRYGLSPLKQDKLNMGKSGGKFHEFIEADSSLSQFLSQQLIACQKGKSIDMKKNILKKQQKLNREWQKTQSYRFQNNIYFTRKPIKAHRKEQAIIKRVQMRRPFTSTELTMRSEEIIYTEPSFAR